MTKICICFKCTANEITCVPKDVEDPSEMFPEWIRFSSYYEHASLSKSFGPLSKVSCFKHYISLIIHKEAENRNLISCSDVLLGRMGHQILMVDLIAGKKVELTLSKFAQATVNGDLMTQKELCKLWPDYFFIINHKWAILAAKKHWHFIHNSWCALFLIQIDPQTGTFTFKDSLVYWNDRSNGYFVEAWQNVDVSSIDAPLCGFAVRNCVDGDPRFDQIMLTLFVSADLRNQKLNVLEKISGRTLNWNNSYVSALVSRKFFMFGVEFGNLMGRLDAIFVNFHQMNIYNLDNPEKGFQLKQLTPPLGYEHEFVRRRPIAPEMVRVAWSSEHFTLCLAAQPPFYNVTNTFLLDLSTLIWHKFQICRPSFRHYCDTFHRFQCFSNQTLIAKSSHVLFDENSKRLVINRWNRAHVRNPSSLLELAWLRTIHLNQLESNFLKTLQSLLQL